MRLKTWKLLEFTTLLRFASGCLALCWPLKVVSTNVQERNWRRLRMRGNSASFPLSLHWVVSAQAAAPSLLLWLICFSCRLSIDSIANPLSPANPAVAAALLLFIFGCSNTPFWLLALSSYLGSKVSISLWFKYIEWFMVVLEGHNYLKYTPVHCNKKSAIQMACIPLEKKKWC